MNTLSEEDRIKHIRTDNKNRLQEFIQKNPYKLPLPIYTTDFVGNVHIPAWVSTVVLYDGAAYKGHIFPNKTHSELSAAYIALQNTVSTTKNSDAVSSGRGVESQSMVAKDKNMYVIAKTPLKLMGKTALLVDIENLHKFIDKLLEDYTFNDKLLTIYVFINKHHHALDKVENYPENIVKMICPSTQTNGSDVYMQLYTGMLVEQNKYEYYIIATRDKFGGILVELLNTTLKNDKKLCRGAYLIVKPSQINEL